MSNILEDGVREGTEYWNKKLEHWGLRYPQYELHKIHTLIEQIDNFLVWHDDIITHLLYLSFISFLFFFLIQLENYKMLIIMLDNKKFNPGSTLYNAQFKYYGKYFIVLYRTKESTMGAYVLPKTRSSKHCQTNVGLWKVNCLFYFSQQESCGNLL